jgi:voltage-gated potassium channel
MKDLRREKFPISPSPNGRPPAAWRIRLHEIIFEADTPAGRTFDIALIGSILLSVLAVMLDSITPIRQAYGGWLIAAEWLFTILFTVEFVLRLLCVGRPVKYATSFFGVIDLLSILPTYLSLLLPGSRYLLIVRILRILRIFRIFKLAAYISEADVLIRSLQASRRKITIFLYTVLTMVTIIGSMMYVIEGAESGFTSIPTGVYWAIVTLTTVGYGDISPATPLGQFLASFVMILGYGIIAVPTGIVTSEMARVKPRVTTQSCRECASEGHDHDASFCKYCGAKL